MCNIDYGFFKVFLRLFFDMSVTWILFQSGANLIINNMLVGFYVLI